MKPLRGPKWPIIRSIVSKGFGRVAAGLGVQDAVKIVLAEALAEKKRKIRKASAGDGTGHNQQVKRYANERARALKKHLVRNRRVGMLDRSTLVRDRTPSPLLDGIDPNRSRNWKRIISRRYKKEFPRLDLGGLNFLDDPIGTMVKLQELSNIDGSEVNAHIDFTDQYCVDIGAYLVVAEIWHQLSPVFRGGKMSPSVQKVLDAVGLGNDLNITLFGQIGHDSVWPFEIRRRRPRDTTQSATAYLRPQGREQLNDDLIQLIDEWLAVASEHADSSDSVTWRLNGDGKANIANMVGELLDNAERHSSAGRDGDWSMAAFMAKRSDSEGGLESMQCYLAFLSVGRSIAESIGTAPQRTREYCEHYAQLHRRCGRSAETLITIAALQDGVTSKHEAVAGGRGGTGLQDALDFIGLLAGAPDPNANARMTIMSGKSCIRLRYPILVGCKDGRGRRVQWCNESNDPKLAPDENIAFDLPAHFAGTLVSMAFTLDAGIFSPTGGLDGQGDD